MRAARWFRRRFFLSGALLAVAACGDSDSTGPAVPSTVALSATALSFDALQETRQLTATVRDQRGDVLESAPVVWTSSASEVASVSDEGLVTALSGGTATITVRSGSASGRASVSVRQIASSIEVSPAVVELQGPGDTATVTAAVSDGGGFEIPGAPLRWESGDEGVVTLSDLGLVTAVGAGSTTITVEATTEGASVGETLDVTVDDGVLAGVEGGRIPVAGGAAVLDIPVGALSEPVFLTAHEATGLPVGSEPIAALDFGPQGLVFDGKVTLTMSYGPAALPPGVSEEELWLYELVGDDFELVTGSAVDTEEHTVSGPIGGFSVYAVLPVGTPPVVPPTGSCSDYPPNALVTFVDEELENEVRGALELEPDGDLTCATAAMLSRLQLIGVPVSDLTGIQNLTGLEQLQVFEVGLTDIGPIGSLPGLTGLTLFWTRVTDISPLAGLTELRSLDLEGSQLIGDYTPLGALTNLRSLSLQILGIRDLSPLASLTRLSSLNLAETTVTDLGPLSGLTSLSDLVLHSNYALSDIQPLLDNPGIGPGDRIVLQNTSVPCDDIALLEARGVTVVDDCPTITTTSLPDAVVDVPYSYRLEVNGRYFDASPNTDWSVVGGALPAGLSLEDDGTISGTPGEAGTFDFVVEYAVHGGPVVLSDQQALTLTVGSPLGTGFALDQFSRIPAGTFQMGDITGSGRAHERPVHTVNISRDFYMQRTEVTQAQWQEVMGENPSMYPGCDLCPVEQVSWSDVQTFLSRLNAAYPDADFRLPTEAEWEYAARAGTTGDYGGTGVADDMGWYFANTPGGAGTSWGDGKKYQPVALKLANDWGLYDMHGNVLEWVQDWYSATFYSESPTIDPTGPSSGTNRVARGGSFLGGPSTMRSATRYGLEPPTRWEDLGVRLVRSR